jgi:hypothetical protein
MRARGRQRELMSRSTTCFGWALALVAACCPTGSLAADPESFVIPLEHRYRVGDRWRTKTVMGQKIRRVVVSQEDKKVRDDSFQNRVQFTGVCTVAAVAKNGDWSKLSVEVEQFVFLDEGTNQNTTLLKPESKFVIEVTEKGKSVTMSDGRAARSNLTPIVGTMFPSEAGQSISRAEAFALKTARKPGEHWKGDKEKILSMVRGFSDDPKSIVVESKAELVTAQNDGRRHWLDVKLEISLTSDKPPGGRRGTSKLTGMWGYRIPADDSSGPVLRQEKTTTSQVYRGREGTPQADLLHDGVNEQTLEMQIEYLTPATGPETPPVKKPS